MKQKDDFFIMMEYVKDKNIYGYLYWCNSPNYDCIQRDNDINNFDIMVKQYSGYFKDKKGEDDPNKYFTYTMNKLVEIYNKWNKDKDGFSVVQKILDEKTCIH